MNDNWTTLQPDELSDIHLASQIQIGFENADQVVGGLAGIHHSLVIDEETGETEGATITELDVLVQQQLITFVVTEDDTVRLLKNKRWA